jgi:Xaa-Pro aminopeptidase
MKLQQLRTQLQAYQYDVFIIPSNDEFNGEYTPDYAKRLEWLTGAAVSNGCLLVTQTQAIFFTDGRYTLQLTKELDPEHYIIINFKDQTIANWLQQNMGLAAKIAYDPWLHNTQFVTNLKRAGLKLEACTENLVDLIWTERPARPTAQITIHDLAHAGITAQHKKQQLQAKLQQQQIDCLVISAPDSLCWLLNIRGSDVLYTPLVLSFALFHSTSEIELFIESKRLTPEVLAHLGNNVTIHPPHHLTQVLLKLKGKTVQLDPQQTAYFFQEQLEQQQCKIITAPDPIQSLKSCKNPTEIVGTIAAHITDGLALCKLLHWLEGNILKLIQIPGRRTRVEERNVHSTYMSTEDPDVRQTRNLNQAEYIQRQVITEMSLAQQLLQFRQESPDFIYPSFATIAGFASNGAIIHYSASPKTDRILEPNNLLLLDSGGQYLYGTTDVTRTISLGQTTKEQAEHFTLVLKGHIMLANCKFPRGTTGSQLDSLARYNLWQHGLNYDHGTGHGVGSYLSVHEGPQRISPKTSDVVLMPGMILSNEPGYYPEGKYGIRIENLHLVEENPLMPEFLQFRNLTLAPLDHKLIEMTMLSESERQWINDYHQQVWESLSTLSKSAEFIEWLRRATREI